MNQLRPLSFGEILDAALKMYSRHWWRFAIAGLVIVIPAQLIDGLIRSSTLDSISDGFLFYTDRTAYTAGRIAIALVDYLASLIFAGVIFRAATEAYMLRRPSVGGSFRYALARLHSLFWLNLLILGGVVLGLILLIIPGIYLWILWVVSVPVLMVEGARGTKAMRRSAGLVSGRWWSVFGLVLVGVAVIPGIAALLVGLIASLIVVHSNSLGVYVLVQGLAGVFVQAFVLPIGVAVTTVLYFDLRVRKEGFDVAMMVDALGLEHREGDAVGIAGLPPLPYPAPAPPAPYPAPPTGPLAPPSGAPMAGSPPAAYPPPPPPSSSQPPPPPPGWAPPVAPDVELPEDPEPGTG